MAARFSAIEAIRVGKRPVPRPEVVDETNAPEALAAALRPLEATGASPIAVLCDPDVAAEIAGWPLRRLERRRLIYAMAVRGRGRGRRPKALQAEAGRLNRADRLLARLQRPRVDARQEELPFLAGMARQPTHDWAWLLGWRNFDNQ